MNIASHRKAWGAIALVGLGTAVGVWWNLHRVSLDNYPHEYLIKTVVPRYKSLDFQNLSSLEDVQSHFLHTPVVNTRSGETVIKNGAYPLALTPRLEAQGGRIHLDSLTQPQVDSLLMQAAELVYYRLLNDDPLQYLSVRHARGAYAPDAAKLVEIGWGDIGPMVRHYLQREPRADDTAETIVTESFTWWKDKTRVKEVRGLAKPGDGFICTLGLIDQTHKLSVDIYTTALGVDGWSGSAPTPSGTFLFPDKTANQLLEAYGALPYAMIGTVVDYKSADPQGIVWIFMWNPGIKDWHFMSALFVNRKDQDARYLPHF
jgi:hypothetical protein